MMTYKYSINGKEVSKVDAIVAVMNKEGNVCVTELVNGKYNGHYENYIPKYAR